MSLKPTHSAMVLRGEVRIAPEHLSERTAYAYSIRCSGVLAGEHVTCVVELEDSKKKISNQFQAATLHFIYKPSLEEGQKSIGLFAGRKQIFEFRIV
ncbi:hypothetical protein [Parasedimentitalea huanghaiensis]|uniref:Uncharacterized protein n=1 Tax=Parasedimentitalea huanghaiensis TaxID=2682100 RepID=A0A6L6WL10_9RHOB|nr:hypothetical protein [Zongyanglinia huanghaiensis]MVO18121.1 hypothetical protein [Zongyanglinia huanghaiensis]